MVSALLLVHEAHHWNNLNLDLHMDLEASTQKLAESKQIAAELERKISRQKMEISQLRQEKDRRKTPDFQTPSTSDNARTVLEVPLVPKWIPTASDYQTARKKLISSWNFNYNNSRQISQDPLMRAGLAKYVLWSIAEYESISKTSLGDPFAYFGSDWFHKFKQQCNDFDDFFNTYPLARYPNDSPYPNINYKDSFAEFFYNVQRFLSLKLQYMEQIAGHPIKPGEELESIFKIMIPLGPYS